jgi:hypothetical protein
LNSFDLQQTSTSSYTIQRGWSLFTLTRTAFLCLATIQNFDRHPFCTKLSEHKATNSTLLVPSPNNPPEGYTVVSVLQNCDYREVDRKKYTIDLSLQVVLNLATIEAFIVKAGKRWMKVIKSDVLQN